MADLDKKSSDVDSCMMSGNSTDLPSGLSNQKDDFAASNPQPSPDLPDELELNEDRIVKHIMVIGFHHKHGYQVDYCYPPLKPNGPVFSTPEKPIILPSCWKTLPLLCLPDGSHNYDSDTIYFTMPHTQIDDDDRGASEEDLGGHSSTISGNCDGIKTIFGTACYRQIQADKLLNRTDDMTRVAVQKSVCVLSRKPLFGLIRSKLEMITHAYFEELDFSKVKILKLTYNNLNNLLSRDSINDNATFLGLSARQLVKQFGCNTLVLFKAMMLERKILFYKSPVKDLCSTIISMCSLFAGLLECGGLDHSTCDLQLSPDLLEALKLSAPCPKDATTCDEEKTSSSEGKVFFSPSKEEVVIIKDTNPSINFSAESDNQKYASCEGSQVIEKNDTSGEMSEIGFEIIPDQKEQPSQTPEASVSGADECLSDGSIVDDPQALRLCRMEPSETGLPLQIFTRGSFCLPYLSISYLDLLADSRVRSFVIGATNFLFKQKRELYDIIVDMDENSIIINDPALKRCLALTTEDLRFMDCLNRHVKVDQESTKDEFNLISQDISRWVGGDEWIRYHFRLYTLYLLKAAKTNMNLDTFNSSFVQTWKRNTNNYKIWEASGKAHSIDQLQSKHPFSSAARVINLNDMKLKLSYAVNNSEKGRMINQTLTGIGKWSIWTNLANTVAGTGVTPVTSDTSSNRPAQVYSDPPRDTN